MHEVERLKRAVLSLPSVALRVDWLADHIGRQDATTRARLMNSLCEESERSDPDAREALLPFCLLLVAAGECDLLQSLRQRAHELHLLALGRVVRRAPPPAEWRDDARVPDYGTGRELTLGERRSLARRPNRRAFDKLLSDPHPMVIHQLLDNPKLTEDDVIRMAARRPGRPDTLRAVAGSKKWMSRGRVRLSLILNPNTPPEIAMPLLAVCKRTELREVIASSEANRVLRATALELFERRPPIRGVDRADAVLQ
jgi:hypothetical protein